MINQHDDTTCGICARQAIGIGFHNGGRSKIMWLCDDPFCLQTAMRNYDMKQDKFSRIESMAAQDGGQVAGHYLQTIDKTDMASLTPDEWAEFCRRLIAGYRKALANLTKQEAAQ